MGNSKRLHGGGKVPKTGKWFKNTEELGQMGEGIAEKGGVVDLEEKSWTQRSSFVRSEGRKLQKGGCFLTQQNESRRQVQFRAWSRERAGKGQVRGGVIRN